MEVDNVSFPYHLLQIIHAISDAEFVSFDLELSGIPSRQPGRARVAGRQTLEDRYQEAKDGADKHQILQVGLTCARFDYIANKYVLRPYNINISPLVADRLNFERDITFQSGAVSFLLSHGFQFDKPFTHGVQYLSREEAERVRKTEFDRIDNKNVFQDMQLKETDVDSLDFMRRVREAIARWQEAGNSSSLTITTHTGLENGRSLPQAITRFEKRLVHQLVRAEYRDLVSLGKADCIKLIYLDEQREAENRGRQKYAVKERIKDNIGFRWIVEALARGGQIEELDPYYFAKDSEGMVVAGDIGKIKETIGQSALRLKDRPTPTLVGHNMFTDLVYFYRCFIGPLPDTLQGFCTELHQLFPRIVDTKYLATHDGGDLNVSPTLQEIAESLELQALPDIVTHSQHQKYHEKEAFHEAGYDSLLTATIMLRLSTKLHAGEEAAIRRRESSDSFKTTIEFLDGREHVEEAIQLPPISNGQNSRVPVSDSGVGLDSDELAQETGALSLRNRQKKRTSKSKSRTTRKEKKDSKTQLPSNPTNSRFASRNSFAYLQTALDEHATSSSSSSETASNGRQSPDSATSWADEPYESNAEEWPIDALVRQPMEMMPDFDNEFWHKFGNKLRIFGTQEAVLDIAGWEKSEAYKAPEEPVFY